MTPTSLIALQQLGHTVAQISPVAASLLLASIWRGALLAFVVYLGFKCAPKLPAAVRSVVWMCVLLVIIASPALALVFASPASSAGPYGLLHVDVRWSYALLACWGVTSCFRLAQLALSAVQLRGLARRAVPVILGDSMNGILCGTPRSVELCVSREIDRPSVIGFFRPRILLPPDLLASMSESEVQQIVLHELEHLRRRDDWTNLLQKLSVALLPLHPVVIWLDRRLCLERELACDDGVVRATQARRSYAACLTNLAQHSLLRRGVSLALGAVGSWKPRSEVAKRVCRILAKPEAAMGRTQARFAAGTVLAGVLGGAVILAHTPHLISFTPVITQQAAVTHEASGTVWLPPSKLPVSATLASARMSSAPHAVFASTVMTNHASPRTTRASLPLRSRKTPVARRSERRIVKSLPQAAPLFRLAAWHEVEMPMPRFALAVQQDSPFTYAAVPVRGGWLIVQL